MDATTAPMGLLDACYADACDYPGGLAVIAMRLGKKESTLRRELTGVEGYKFGLGDAVRLYNIIRGARIRAAFGAELDLILLEPPELHDSDGCLFTAFAVMQREVSEYIAEASDAAARRDVCDNKRRKLEKELNEAIAGLHQMQQRLRGINAAGKPAHALDAA